MLFGRFTVQQEITFRSPWPRLLLLRKTTWVKIGTGFSKLWWFACYPSSGLRAARSHDRRQPLFSVTTQEEWLISGFGFCPFFFFFPYYRASLTEGSFFSEWVLYIFQLSVNFISKSFQDNYSGSAGSSIGCFSKEDSFSVCPYHRGVTTYRPHGLLEPRLTSSLSCCSSWQRRGKARALSSLLKRREAGRGHGGCSGPQLSRLVSNRWLLQPPWPFLMVLYLRGRKLRFHPKSQHIVLRIPTSSKD